MVGYLPLAAPAKAEKGHHYSFIGNGTCLTPPEATDIETTARAVVLACACTVIFQGLLLVNCLKRRSGIDGTGCCGYSGSYRSPQYLKFTLSALTRQLIQLDKWILISNKPDPICSGKVTTTVRF